LVYKFTSCDKMAKAKAMSFCIILLMASHIEAGPAAYGICQAGCAALAVACYAAGGAVFGTVTAGVGTPAVILGCNLAFGKCSAACIAAGFLPTP
jgi:hypothetical protein